MFLQDSDGLVFKGAMGPWYSPETGQFHVSRAEAARLIEPLSVHLERRDRGAAVLHVRLHLVNKEVHERSLQLPAPMREVAPEV